MRRREFMLIGCAAVLPRAARAQQASPLPRVGLVSIGADPGDPVVFRPFLEQLRELGYVEGRNIILERRFAAGRDELIGDFVADLVQRKVDIIVVTGNRESITAKHATSTIPIVTIVSSDPIRTGLAASLARPGGNVTGLTTMDWGIYGKRIEILKQRWYLTCRKPRYCSAVETAPTREARLGHTTSRRMHVRSGSNSSSSRPILRASKPQLPPRLPPAHRRLSGRPTGRSAHARGESPKAPSRIDSRRCLPSGRTW